MENGIRYLLNQRAVLHRRHHSIFLRVWTCIVVLGVIAGGSTSTLASHYAAAPPARNGVPPRPVTRCASCCTFAAGYAMRDFACDLRRMSLVMSAHPGTTSGAWGVAQQYSDFCNSAWGLKRLYATWRVPYRARVSGYDARGVFSYPCA